MGVYVDSLKPCLMSSKWRHRESAHLFADTEEELLGFGRRIGLKASWLQRGSMIHFDVTGPARRRAVLNGAVEVDNKFVADRIRQRRQVA